METLRKFGLHHPDLSTMVSNVAVFLRILALEIDSRNPKSISPAIYLFMAVTFCSYFYTFHVSTIWFICWHGGGELQVYIILFSLLISSLIGVIKLLYMYIKSKKLKKIVSEYLQCDAIINPESRLARNIKTTLRTVKRRATIYWLIINANGIVYSMKPLLSPGRHLTQDGQVLWGLEPRFESPNYEIAFVVECLAVFLTCYTPANITAFLIIIVGYTEAQMLALSQELLHLWNDAQSHYQRLTKNQNLGIGSSNDRNAFDNFAQSSKDSLNGYPASKNDEFIGPSETYVKNDVLTKEKKIVNDFIKQRLVSIMKIHAMNIDLIKKVENIFQGAMAIEFILLSGGFIAELLGGLENTYVQMPFALVQVAMDCIVGQKLIDANETFSDALYDSKWENFDLSNMKSISVMLQNAQKSMKLSAAGVNYLNHSTLMSVFKSIYSAYAALRTIMNKHAFD